jgi:hypothetical protein
MTGTCGPAAWRTQAWSTPFTRSGPLGETENISGTSSRARSCRPTISIDGRQINHHEFRRIAQASRRTPISDLILKEINWDQPEIHPKVTQIFSQGPI